MMTNVIGLVGLLFFFLGNFFSALMLLYVTQCTIWRLYMACVNCEQQFPGQHSYFRPDFQLLLSLFHISLAADVHLSAMTNFLVSYGSLTVL